VRNDANNNAQQAAITTAGDHRRKKVNLHCINQIGISENHRGGGGTGGPEKALAVQSLNRTVKIIVLSSGNECEEHPPDRGPFW
jgi:hypothetical protein